MVRQTPFVEIESPSWASLRRTEAWGMMTVMVLPVSSLPSMAETTVLYGLIFVRLGGGINEGSSSASRTAYFLHKTRKHFDVCCVCQLDLILQQLVKLKVPEELSFRIKYDWRRMVKLPVLNPEQNGAG